LIFLRFNILLIFVCLFCFNQDTLAQNAYRVFLKDKYNTEYNPFSYLHPKAIERRIIHGLDLCDPSDFPLNEDYLRKITSLSDSIHGQSRWMNAVFVFCSEENIAKIAQLPFVQSIEKTERFLGTVACELDKKKVKPDFDTSVSPKDKALLAAQLDRIGRKILSDSGLDGRGVIVCIVDVGFKSYSYNPAFEHIRKRKGILATYDFVKKREDIDISMAHGTNVFSCLGGQAGPYQIGLATGANYLLARTENITEFLNEEENWLMAAEWADKNGADIINSSLGYTHQRYVPENMDGKTTFVSRAAQIAVNKGILVVSSAGNEGSGSWKRVAAPGDAPGVLTVGGIDPKTGIHIDFSSYGPSWDKRLKPEICAYGRALASSKHGLTVVDGTSFSSPLVAGFAACLKQKFPTMTNVQLKDLICRSGDLWPYYDYAHGYGVPQPYFLFKDTIEENPSLKISENNDEIILTLAKLDTSLDSVKSLTQDSLQTINLISDSSVNQTLNDTFVINPTNDPKFNYSTQMPEYLFYHIKNKKGYLDKYYVLDMKDESNEEIIISKTITDKPFSIEFFYKGYYKELIIKE
jgi:serine protease AprX